MAYRARRDAGPLSFQFYYVTPPGSRILALEVVLDGIGKNISLDLLDLLGINVEEVLLNGTVGRKDSKRNGFREKFIKS